MPLHGYVSFRGAKRERLHSVPCSAAARLGHSRSMAKARADQLLVDRGLAESRARAQALILAGLVFSGERKIDKAGQALAADAPLEVRGQGPSLGVARRDQAGARARPFRLGRGRRGRARRRQLDRRLHRRAAAARARRRSIAVDVGTNQLAWKLRQDPRVIVHEQTNARYLTARDRHRAGRHHRLRRKLHRARQGARHGARLRPARRPADRAGQAAVRGGAGRDRQGRRGPRPGGARARLRGGCGLGREPRLDGSRASTQSPITGPEGNVEFLLGALSAADRDTLTLPTIPV